MLTQFFSVGIIVLLGAMIPGPNFAIVSKNSIFHSRHSGVFTSLGVGVAILLQISFSSLGLAWVFSESLLLFKLIKYLGAAYLIYLGASSFLTQHQQYLLEAGHVRSKQSELSPWKSFRQGILCDILNINSSLFYLALSTSLLTVNTSWLWRSIYTAEIILVSTSWYACWAFILTDSRIKRHLERIEKYIAKVLGIILLGFGVALVFVNP